MFYRSNLRQPLFVRGFHFIAFIIQTSVFPIYASGCVRVLGLRHGGLNPSLLAGVRLYISVVELYPFIIMASFCIYVRAHRSCYVLYRVSCSYMHIEWDILHAHRLELLLELSLLIVFFLVCYYVACRLM